MIYFSSTSVTRTSPFQCICFIVVLSNQDNSNKKISLINKSGHQRNLLFDNMFGGRHGCDGMVVGVTTTYVTSAYHHKRVEFKFCSWRGALDTHIM